MNDMPPRFESGPRGISQAQAYELGKAHGLIPGHPFDPNPFWLHGERPFYSRGFDDGVDILLNTKEAA